MKKSISIILLLCLCFGVVSCTPDEPEISYESEIIDENGFFNLVIFERHGAVGIEESITERHMPDKTIEFMGKAYTGRYQHSSIPIKGLLPSYKAYYDAKNKVSFYVDEITGNVIYFARNTQDVIAEEKQAIERGNVHTVLFNARNIANEYVGNISEYHITIDGLDENPIDNTDGYGWNVTYTKNVQGYPTSDYISISITHSGIIEEFRIGCIGAFDDFEQEIDADKVEESIKSKLSSFYGEKGSTINDILFADEYLFKTSDGKVCLLSDVTVYLTLPDGTETIEHPRVSTLIKN